jgi:glycosyltransferase involved in cell wall biosynthesis
MEEKLDIVFIESFDGGSHRSFRLGLEEHSAHRFRAFTLPPRFWKWRMRGAAVWFADQLAAAPEPCDLILATSLLDLADLRGLLPSPLDHRPLVLYMHENQLTYPLSPHEAFDFHFGFTNIVSCLAADAVVFNSDFHRDLFLESLPTYLGRMPEAVPPGLRERIAARSHVLPVGLHRAPHRPPAEAVWRGSPCAADAGPRWPRGDRPLILWNHRWEFDKRPQQFVAAIDRLLAANLDFDVVLLGDDRHHAEVFAPLRERLGAHLRHAGFLADRGGYEAWLDAADIVVSCADQEYFGISVAEAVHAGCYPVLPRRQVYPHLYGPLCRGRHFYETDEELAALLGDLVRGEGAGHVCSLARDVDAFCWFRLAPRYDALLGEIAASGKKART